MTTVAGEIGHWFGHKRCLETMDFSQSETTMLETVESDGMQYQYRYLNQLPLKKSHPYLMVNFLECCETNPDWKRQCLSCAADLKITTQNVERSCGRVVRAKELRLSF